MNIIPEHGPNLYASLYDMWAKRRYYTVTTVLKKPFKGLKDPGSALNSNSKNKKKKKYNA